MPDPSPPSHIALDPPDDAAKAAAPFLHVDPQDAFGQGALREVAAIRDVTRPPAGAVDRRSIKTARNQADKLRLLLEKLTDPATENTATRQEFIDLYDRGDGGGFLGTDLERLNRMLGKLASMPIPSSDAQRRRSVDPERRQIRQLARLFRRCRGVDPIEHFHFDNRNAVVVSGDFWELVKLVVRGNRTEYRLAEMVEEAIKGPDLRAEK